MACSLTKRTQPTVFFEGAINGAVTIDARTEEPGARVKLISAVYDGAELTITRDGCASFQIKRGSTSLLVKVEARPSRAWVRVVECCEECGSEHTKVLQRFKAPEPPSDRQVIIKGIKKPIAT